MRRIYRKAKKANQLCNKENKMRKIIVSEGMTVDGIFEAETMGKWAQPTYSDERDEVIRKLVLASDSLLLGRTTYDLQAWYWPSQKDDKYGTANHKNSITKYVVTSKPLQTPWNNSLVIKENVLEEIAKLKQQPGGGILIEGSATLVESLAQASLIDEYRFLVHPAIMGSGKRFFKEGTDMTRLKLVESKTLPLGVVLLCYEPTR